MTAQELGMMLIQIDQENQREVVLFDINAKPEAKEYPQNALYKLGKEAVSKAEALTGDGQTPEVVMIFFANKMLTNGRR